MTDGLFLETFYETAKKYPEIKADDVIVDDLAMKMVSKPDLFDIIVLPNLQVSLSDHDGRMIVL